MWTLSIDMLGAAGAAAAREAKARTKGAHIVTTLLMTFSLKKVAAQDKRPVSSDGNHTPAQPAVGGFAANRSAPSAPSAAAKLQLDAHVTADSRDLGGLVE